jgi:hypothetical protein
MPQYFDHISSPLRDIAIWLVEFTEARTWRHDCPELIKFVDTGMLKKEAHYPEYPERNYTEIDGMM